MKMIRYWKVASILLFVVGGAASLYFMRNVEHNIFLKQERLIPFEASMAKRDPSFVTKIISKKLRKDSRWKTLRELYQRNILDGKATGETRIPKIIHQIWLGGPLPEKYKEIQKSWLKHHPDWEYRLWTDESAKALKMQNRDLFESAVNWGEKADILRYEILYQFGGLYVDTDFECLRPMDLLHQLCDFYIGLESIEKKFQSPRLSNALIAAAPRHPILKKCIESISGEGPRDNFDLIQSRTGPGLVTRIFLASMSDDTHKNVALPSSYFYPLPSAERNGTFQGSVKETWAEDESYAIHYWDGSWIK
ncbi:MAG: hypothetical protein HYX48_06565 [Chlamydiales bacterium]|nr:hypothetical protein [Chlamydiales bacterium]